MRKGSCLQQLTIFFIECGSGETPSSMIAELSMSETILLEMYTNEGCPVLGYLRGLENRHFHW